MLFAFIIKIVFSADCPSKSDDYLDLSGSTRSGKKYYSCSKQYGSMERFDLTNSILSIYFCTFTKTVAYEFSGYKNKGAIHLIFNNNKDAALTGLVDIQFNTFKGCIGCAIMIESTETSIDFNIFNCTFDDCQSMSGAAVIDYKAVNGRIEKCYFYNGYTTVQNYGYIHFEPPTIDANDNILTITSNTFEHQKTSTSYSLFVISNNNCKFDFNNNKVIFNEALTNMYAITYPDTVTNFDGWSFK